MNAHNLLIALCLSLLMLAFTACDSGSSGIPEIKDTTVRNPDPGTEILPHTPPDWTSPIEPDPNGGGNGNGGSNDQQPVPEPSTLVLVGSGIALITLCRKKKKKQEEL